MTVTMLAVVVASMGDRRGGGTACFCLNSVV